MTQKKIRREDFGEAHNAMLQAASLVEIGQECYNNFEDENIYCLLGVLGEKVTIALNFFEENDCCWLRTRQNEQAV